MRLRRVAAAGIGVALLAVGTVGPGQAQNIGPAGGAVVREVVYGDLAPDGELQRVRVAQLVELTGSAGREASVTVPAGGSDDSYRTVSGFGGPARVGQELQWRTAERLSAVALAELDRDLPLKVKASYRLDGERVEAGELKGRAGEVQIALHLENVTRQTRPVTFDPVTQDDAQSRSTLVYVPIEYTVVLEFPAGKWHDVGVDLGHVQTNERGDQIVMRPGVLNPPVGPSSEEVVVTASSDRIMLPDIRVLAVPRVAPQSADWVAEHGSGLGSLYGTLGTVNGILNQVYGGTLQLGEGLDQIAGGVGVRDPATRKPVVELGPGGTPTSVLGAIGFISETIGSQVLPAVGRRDASTGQPVVDLSAAGVPTTAIGALGFMGDAIGKQILPAIGQRDAVTGAPVVGLDASGTPTTVIGALGFMSDAIGSQVLPAIGRRDPQTGKPVVNLDASGTPTTAIGALGFMGDAITGQLLVAIGEIDPATGRVKATPHVTLLGGLEQMKDGLDLLMIPGLQTQILPGVDGIAQIAQGGMAATAGVPGLEVINDLFTQIAGIASTVGTQGLQPLLAGLQDMSAGVGAAMAGINSNDPASPGLVEGLKLVAGGLDALAGQLHTLDPARPGLVEGLEQVQGGMLALAGQLHTLDPARPGLVEGLGQVQDGLGALAAQLHTLDSARPGLVEGLGQIQGGLDALAATIHTLDDSRPGLVEGLNLARSGAGQLAQGIFAANELFISNTHASLGAAADNAALNQAILEQQGDEIGSATFLAAGADSASTSYVLQIPGQSTTVRDNAVRGGLMAMLGLGAAILGRRTGLGLA